MLHNLAPKSPHEHGALWFHTPGHMVTSPSMEGVICAGPVTGDGAELFAAIVRIIFMTIAATQQEPVKRVVVPLHSQARGQPA